jgi:hypothetical protein
MLRLHIKLHSDNSEPHCDFNNQGKCTKVGQSTDNSKFEGSNLAATGSRAQCNKTFYVLNLRMFVIS